MSNKKIVNLGIIFQLLGYIGIIFSAILLNPLFFILGMILFSFGDAIFTPAYIGLISLRVDESSQGKIHGSIQAFQALARIFGPIAGGVIYVLFLHIAPMMMSIILLVLAIYILKITD